MSEATTAQLMKVQPLDGAGHATCPPCALAECFPDDPDEIALVIDCLAKGERYHGGGGAAPEFWIERVLA